MPRREYPTHDAARLRRRVDPRPELHHLRRDNRRSGSLRRPTNHAVASCPGQRRIHFNNERDRRRDQILKKIATINVGCIICTARDSSQDAARALALSDMVTRLLGRGVVHLVLETRQGQDHRDRVVIGETVARAGIKRRFTYHHQAPVGEPMLWVPDAVAWAWGRDSVWQQLVKRLQLVNDA